MTTFVPGLELRRVAERWPVGGIDQIRNVLRGVKDRRQLVGLFGS